jgi:hypothetical protein
MYAHPVCKYGRMHVCLSVPRYVCTYVQVVSSMPVPGLLLPAASDGVHRWYVTPNETTNGWGRRQVRCDELV